MKQTVGESVKEIKKFKIDWLKLKQKYKANRIKNDKNTFRVSAHRLKVFLGVLGIFFYLSQIEILMALLNNLTYYCGD